MKKVKKILIVLFALIIISFLTGFICFHRETKTITINSTCLKEGAVYTICSDCDEVLYKESIEKKDHEWSDENVVVQPFKRKSGVLQKKCITCGTIFADPYICQHNGSHSHALRKATCLEEGVEQTVCNFCETVLDEQIINKTEHSYTEWKVTKYATPVETGSRYKKCTQCGHTITESYSMSMAGPTSLYIPGTGINHTMTIGRYSQSDINAHKVVYVPSVHGIGASDPFILGHKERVLGPLYKTKIGQKIYVSIDGVIETYEVVISEYAEEDSTGVYIIGKNSGTVLQQAFGYKTLHIYTCYGSSKIGRWMVLAKLV